MPAPGAAPAAAASGVAVASNPESPVVVAVVVAFASVFTATLVGAACVVVSLELVPVVDGFVVLVVDVTDDVDVAVVVVAAVVPPPELVVGVAVAMVTIAVPCVPESTLSPASL